MITVGEVEQTIKLYLSIQKIRFNDRLDYHIHVDNGAKNVLRKQVYLPAHSRKCDYTRNRGKKGRVMSTSHLNMMMISYIFKLQIMELV